MGDVFVQDLHLRDVGVLVLQACDIAQIVGSHGAQEAQSPQWCSCARDSVGFGVCVHSAILNGWSRSVLNRIDTLRLFELIEEYFTYTL
jgi:hypothetical protein